MRLAQRFEWAELLRPKVIVELRHQRFRGFVVHFPQAGDGGSRAGDLNGALQAQHALAAGHRPQARFASRERDQFGAVQVEPGDFEFTKANITFRAIIVLCEQGLDRPATALSRSLFETLMNLTFLARKQVSLRVFNDSKSKPTSPWPLHGRALTADFRLALFNAWSILRDEKAIEGWQRTAGLKRQGHRTSKRIARLDRSYADSIGPAWAKAIKSKITCVGMDIASFAASLGPAFRKWHRTVYARDSSFVHQSDTSSYLAVTSDRNFTPRIFTSAREVSGVLLRASTIYLGCVEELNKRFRFGDVAKKEIRDFEKRLRRW